MDGGEPLRLGPSQLCQNAQTAPPTRWLSAWASQEASPRKTPWKGGGGVLETMEMLPSLKNSLLTDLYVCVRAYVFWVLVGVGVGWEGR